MSSPSDQIVLHPLHGPGLDDAIEALAGIELITTSDDNGVVDALSTNASILVTFQWDDRFLTPGLRWIQAISAGFDQFPLDAIRRHGVVLTSARGAHSPAVVEHVVALTMALVRRVGRAVRRATRHTWQPEMAFEVAGLTATVLGFGSIGAQVASRLRTLGVEVIGVRRRPDLSKGGVTVVEPGRLLWACERSDILVCTLPNTPETEGLVGAQELDALGAGWLVNVGRGTTVDEAALIAALDKGELRGAALDVTSQEPLPEESPLWDMEDVIITPHMAWASDRLAGRLSELFARNLTAFRGEGPWATRVV